MTDPLAKVVERRGHFRLESGFHGDTWLDLDALFVRPQLIAPSIAALADRLRAYDITVVCGPLVGGAFVAQSLSQMLCVDFAFTERVVSSDDAGLYAARYRLGRTLAERVSGQRVALVDDVMSAGSSLLATHGALLAAGAIPVVVATLAVLGSRGSDRFAALDLPVETLSRKPLASWPPHACPLCRSGVPLEEVASGSG